MVEPMLPLTMLPISSYLIDSHCHFDFPQLDTIRDDSVARAHQLGIRQWVVPGVTAASWARIENSMATYEGVFPAWGLHPYFIDQHQPEHLELLAAQLRRHPAVAVGEFGLDRMLSGELHWQQQLFYCEHQLQLAQQLQLPVILHVRKAHSDMLALLRRYPLPRAGVLHAFSGSHEEAKRYLALGFSFGVGGSISYERATRTREVFRQLPLQSLLLETDAPDMPLSGYQGQPNRLERLHQVLMLLAELRQLPPDVVAQQVTANTRALFALPPPSACPEAGKDTD